jgi:hypothetical protein
LIDSGADGMSKVVDKFLENHPEIPKRQIEIKVNEVAVKEKRDGNSKIVWHIKPEFQQYLQVEFASPKPAPKRVREEEEVITASDGRPKKFKRAFGFFVKDKRIEAQDKLSTKYAENIPVSKFK